MASDSFERTAKVTDIVTGATIVTINHSDSVLLSASHLSVNNY